MDSMHTASAIYRDRVHASYMSEDVCMSETIHGAFLVRQLTIVHHRMMNTSRTEQFTLPCPSRSTSSGLGVPWEW